MRKLFALLLFLLPMAAHAQFYVCASNCYSTTGTAVTPSDSNNGTSVTTPFLTLTKAQTSMQGSGTKKTIILAGTYVIGTATPANPWTFTASDNGTSYVAYPGATVIISGGGSQNAANGAITTSGSPTGLVFKGLTFQNLGSVSGANGSIYILGNSSTNTGIVFDHNIFTNCVDLCIQFSGVAGTTVTNNRFQNILGTNANTGLGVDYSQGSNTAVFKNNYCENMYYGCVSTESTSGAIHDIAIDSNVVVNPCLKDIALSDMDCGALYLGSRAAVSTNMSITNNVVMGANVDALNTNSILTATGAKGIYLDDCASNVEVSGNLLYNNVGLWPIFYHGSINAHVHNNVFVLAPGGVTGAELGVYSIQSSPACGAGTNGVGMTGNTFQNNTVIFQGAWPGSAGPWENLNGVPTNYPAIDHNLYYMQSGVTFKNTNITGTGGAAGFVDTAPIICGPSTGASPLGNITPQQLWGLLAAGTISSWQQLPTNQGPTFRGCAAGQF